MVALAPNNMYGNIDRQGYGGGNAGGFLNGISFLSGDFDVGIGKISLHKSIRQDVLSNNLIFTHIYRKYINFTKNFHFNKIDFTILNLLMT